MCFNRMVGYMKGRALVLDERGFGEVDGALCFEHIIDPALADRFTGHVDAIECSVCGRSGGDSGPFAVRYEYLLGVVMETVRHFYADADAVLPWNSEDHALVGPQADTWEVVADVASGAFAPEVEDDVLSLLTDVIGDGTSWTSWMSDADTDDLDYAWDQFAQITRYGSRLVIAVGRPGDPPTQLAAFLEQFVLYASDALGLVAELPAGTRFYRGRLSESPRAIRKHSDDLGPAPEGRAAANRMSPAGIGLFYASADEQTAIAEIAGHGVEPFAVIGEFSSTRATRVLDFTRQPPQISPFDLERREHARLGRFLAAFVRYISEPVIPDGRQHVEYAPTQVLTEYLRWVPEPRLDGIALPSAQTGRPTYVMFSSRDDFTTLGDSTPERRGGLSVGFGPSENPTFVLDPATVTAYKVRREYGGARYDA